MKYIIETIVISSIISCFLVWFFIGVIHLYDNFFHPGITISQSITRLNLSFYVSRKDYVGTCKDTALETSVDVYLMDSMPDADTQGFFDSATDIIAIEKSNRTVPLINVVAHETSHFVDWTLSHKGINDGETRAYLQGYFTSCVMNVLQSKV